MPRSSPLVPEYDVTVHIVLDDFSKRGRVYRETDEAAADLATVVDDILSGQYNAPSRIVAFNTAEGWARDVTEDVAREVLARAVEQDQPMPPSVRAFIERVTGEIVRV